MADAIPFRQLIRTAGTDRIIALPRTGAPAFGASADGTGENGRFKRVVADQALNIQVLKDVLGKQW